MITLFDSKFIFLKPRKVAGTSFEIALSRFASTNSIITPISVEDEITRNQLGFLGAQNFFKPLTEMNISKSNDFTYKKFTRFQLPLKFWNHMSAKNVKKNLGDYIWSNSYKISIVRNPYDIAVSMFFFENKHIENWTSETFNQWCIRNGESFALNQKQYLINGQEVIDFYIRFENFEEDILRLEAQFSELKGLYRLFHNIRAKASYRPQNASTMSLFSNAPEAYTIISQVCAFEIGKFSYKI